MHRNILEHQNKLLLNISYFLKYVFVDGGGRKRTFETSEFFKQKENSLI